MKHLSQLTDEEVVEVVCRGDKEAYAEIIRRYQKKLLRYTRYILGDSHQAADAVQEGLIKAYINLRSFNPKKKFSSWLYRIVHNQAINQIDKHQRQKVVEYDFDIDSGINLEEDMIKRKLIEETQTCLREMPVIYREPLTLYYLEDKSYEEISDILRLPMGTVGTRINRAKVILKKICQKHSQ
jgi:RNA polymerase sigma-70 factor (ECF subfamily)